MDRHASNTLDRTTLIYGFSNNVHDAAESITTNRDLNGGPGVDVFLATNKTLGTIHSDCTDRVLAQVGSDLKDKATATKTFNLECIENWRQVVALELNVNNSTNDSLDVTDSGLCFSRV